MEAERRVEKRWISENIPAELKDLPIWVGFKFIPQEGQKLRKEPFNAATGGKACSRLNWCHPKKGHPAIQNILKKVAII